MAGRAPLREAIEILNHPAHMALPTPHHLQTKDTTTGGGARRVTISTISNQTSDLNLRATAMEDSKLVMEDNRSNINNRGMDKRLRHEAVQLRMV